MDNRFSLEGKVAIIVGGSRGIGEGIATGLSDAGAVIVVANRTQEKGIETAKGIEEYTGRETYAIQTDITKKESVDKLIKEVVDKYGHIDILVNSAGVNVRKDTIDYTPDDWDLVQDVQLKGTFYTCQAVGRHMIENKIKGKIINISSIDSMVVSRTNIVSYMAAKGAITMLTKSLAAEWAPYGICVNSIAPGYFETKMTKPLFQDPAVREELFANIPMKRFGYPYKDLSGLGIYLASGASDYMTGQTLYIDGGYTLI